MKNTKKEYYYLVQIGSIEFSLFHSSNNYIKKVVTRWVSLFWEKKQKEYEGSLYHNINNDHNSRIIIGKIKIENGIVPLKDFQIIENLLIKDFIKKYR